MPSRPVPSVSLARLTPGAALLCALCLAAPAFAAPTEAQLAAAAKLWDQAMLEQSVMLTCGATSQEADKAARKYWEGTRKQALALMEAKGWPAGELAHVAEISTPDQLRMPDATTFGEVLAFCHSYADWPQALHQMAFTPLVDDLARLLETEAQP